MKKVALGFTIFMLLLNAGCMGKGPEEEGTSFITSSLWTLETQTSENPPETSQSDRKGETQTQTPQTTKAPPETTAETVASSVEIKPPTNANAKTPLSISTYDGYNQPCHPKVLYFERGWNGYEYWMTYTPYPYCEDSLENPCIAVSHDGILWTTPEGLKNPVTGFPLTTENSAHYSDPHLLMNGETMELWFRYNPSYSDGVNADSNGAVILRITSDDGKIWSKARVMHDESRANRNPVLSPVVILEDGVYYMWYAKRDGKLYLTTSRDGTEWTKQTAADLRVQGWNIWHQDMIKTDIGYEIVFCAKPHNAKDNLSGLSLFYAYSSDGLHFSEPVKIISPSENSAAFDNLSIYRASILKTKSGYKIYYTAANTGFVWKIGLSAGTSISELTGFLQDGFKQ